MEVNTTNLTTQRAILEKESILYEIPLNKVALSQNIGEFSINISQHLQNDYDPNTFPKVHPFHFFIFTSKKI